MSGRAGTVVLTAAVVATVLAGYAAAAVYTVSRGLFLVAVEVQEAERIHLVLPLPAAAVETGCFLARRLSPEVTARRIDEAIGPWQPVVREVVAALAEVPDATLVRVTEGRDRVVVVKRRGALVVEVDQPDVSVRLRAPARSVERSLHWLLG